MVRGGDPPHLQLQRVAAPPSGGAGVAVQRHVRRSQQRSVQGGGPRIGLGVQHNVDLSTLIVMGGRGAVQRRQAAVAVAAAAGVAAAALAAALAAKHRLP